MTAAAKRAGWALLASAILLWIVAMAFYAFTGTNMLKETAMLTGPMVTGALGLLYYGYKTPAAPTKDDEAV